MNTNGNNRIISVDDHMQLCGPQYLSAVNQHTFPILIEGGKPDYFIQVGTWIAMCAGGKYFLATAGHVVYQILGTGLQNIFIGTGTVSNPGNIHVLPASCAAAWRFHKRPALDLVAAPLTHPIQTLKYCNMLQITHGHLPLMKGHYFLAGYPNSRNKLRDVNPAAGGKSTAIASIIVKVDQTLDFKKDGKNTDDYLGFKYQGVYEDGQHKTQGIHPHGLSGCGLWYFPKQGVESDFYLAGVFIEWHKTSKTGFAVGAKHLLSLMN